MLTVKTDITKTEPTDAIQKGEQATSITLGRSVMALLAFGAGALLWKQLPDLRRYMKMRSM
jgi:hypothetical protein